mmetsp:Transcript_32013/g.36545  ORF Transcript_32013/g.36545 Transcript_32013/m.36545 type:complete len:123 (-) Transcript_32013:203-571(-)
MCTDLKTFEGLKHSEIGAITLINTQKNSSAKNCSSKSLVPINHNKLEKQSSTFKRKFKDDQHVKSEFIAPAYFISSSSTVSEDCQSNCDRVADVVEASVAPVLEPSNSSSQFKKAKKVSFTF